MRSEARWEITESIGSERVGLSVRMAVEPWEFKPGLVLCYVAAPDGVSIEMIQAEETERAIVTQWRFASGAETGWHRRAHDYVVVAGKLIQETANGEIV